MSRIGEDTMNAMLKKVLHQSKYIQILTELFNKREIVCKKEGARYTFDEYGNAICPICKRAYNVDVFQIGDEYEINLEMIWIDEKTGYKHIIKKPRRTQ